jgi:hypothetical protein
MEDEHLISKKDVLEKMGISYGQLYRWKRKGLIPEIWFIRRSTFTGQETFFPEDKIVERIERIKNMKGEHALDDLADVISEHVNAKIQIAFGKLKHLGWFDEDLGRAAGIVIVGNDDGTLSLRDALRLAVLKKLRRSARNEEIDLASRTLDDVIGKSGIDPSVVDGKTLHLFRKQLSGAGISAEISVIIVAGDKLTADPELNRIESVDLGGMLQQVKLDLAACCDSDASKNEGSVNQSDGREEHE